MLAALLFAAGMVVGELIILRSLRASAESLAGSSFADIAARIGPDLSYRGGLPGAPRIARSPDLSSLVVLDLDGRMAVPSGPGGRSRFGFPAAGDRAAYERAIQSGKRQYLTFGGAADGRHGTVFYEPLTWQDKVIGAVRLDVDQTRDVAFLRGAMRALSVMAAVLAAIGLAAALIIVWRHIRDRWQAEEETRFLGLHDVLTGLPNRAQFNRRVERALARARAEGAMLAVFCIDVDNFKDINDTLGHPVGDRVLKATGERILAASGPTSTVARLSGDEFAVLVERVAGPASLRAIALRYLRCAVIPHEIDGQELVCSISIGICTAPADGDDVDTLMKNADLALYRAKADGRNTMRFFTSDMDAELRRRRRIEAELRRDLGSERISVSYQPQFDLRTGSLVGYEALARWTSPELGSVSPAVFVPVAESCGLIGRLGERVLLIACEAAAGWPQPVRLAVNLSAAQFRAGDVAETIERVLRWTRLPPERLEVEITETVLLQNTDAAAPALARLRALGVTIALDDFGTGYSSLSYLSRFPIDKIKIDRSFVQGMGEDANMATIVTAIVGLGRALGIEVTAEGVETRDQVTLLRAIGCHHVQGYLFGAPQQTVDFPVPDVVLMQEELSRAAG